MKFPGFIGPSYESKSPVADSERTINWILEVMESPFAKARAVFYPTPGMTEIADGLSGPVRQVFYEDGRCFFVAGINFCELLEDFSVIIRGTVAGDDKPATIASNGATVGKQLQVIAGGQVYVYDLMTDTLSAPLTTGRQGGFVAGFFTVLDPTISGFRLSNQLDGSVYDAGRVATRTFGSDAWQALGLTRQQVWLFGSKTSEPWYNAGSPNFEFAPIPDAFVAQGIGAAFSVAMIDDESLMWVAANAQGAARVFRTQGTQVVRASNHALEESLSAAAIAGQLESARAFSFQHRGHVFYCLSIPLAGRTWLYDATSQSWTEWLTWKAATNSWEAALPACYALAFGVEIVGDRSSGKLYKLDWDKPTEADGTTIRRMRRCPHVNNEKKQIFYHTLEIDMQVGNGNLVAPGDDPIVMLRCSDDGGRTWNPETSAKAGKIGDYLNRPQFNILGSARDRVFEITVNDPVMWNIVDAYLTLTPGVH